jgi:hypothetical protein
MRSVAKSSPPTRPLCVCPALFILERRICFHLVIVSVAHVVSVEAELTTILNLFTTQAPSTTQAVAAAASTGSPTSIVPIAGAAGGGIVVLVIVVILVVRRKRSAGPSAGPNRTVVAFENPMYETAPKKGNENYDNQQVSYDETGANASAGLYDEPAFMANAEKDNPLYESTEKLNEQGDNGAQNVYGYQVEASLQAPADSGYLDVAGGD